MIEVPYYYLCDGNKMPSKKAYINVYGKKDGNICYALDKWRFSTDKKQRKLLKQQSLFVLHSK